MYSFLNLHNNLKYVDEIFENFDLFRDKFIDDFWSKSKVLQDQQFLQEITKYPAIIALCDNKFMGLAWFPAWQGNIISYHSTELLGFVKKEYHGEHTEKGFNLLLDYIFNQPELIRFPQNIERIKMEISIKNYRASYFAERLNFKLEGILRANTKKDNKNIDYKLYSILKDEFNENIRKILNG